jgi:sulfite reductase beta subunit
MRNPTPGRVRRARPHAVPAPALRKNYGNWKIPRPAAARRAAPRRASGDEVWTVRAGTQRQMDVYTIRKLCDIADKFAEGHVRFTIRSNIEFMVPTRRRSPR